MIGLGSDKNGQFGTAIFGMIFIEIVTKKCWSCFNCQTLSENPVKNNLFLRSCARQGIQTRQNSIFAQDIAENVLHIMLKYIK